VSAGFAVGAPLRTVAGNGYPLHIVLVIINVIEIQVEGKSELRGLPYLLSVEMCAVAGRGKLSNALKLKIVVYPKFSKALDLDMKH
jgi:hypothetical protein